MSSGLVACVALPDGKDIVAKLAERLPMSSIPQSIPGELVGPVAGGWNAVWTRAGTPSWECQKQPWTNITQRRALFAKSGLPGNSAISSGYSERDLRLERTTGCQRWRTDRDLSEGFLDGQVRAEPSRSSHGAPEGACRKE